MEESVKWLEWAENDYSDRLFNLEAEKARLASFLFQQAAEKALKALQIKSIGIFDRTHDLTELAKSLSAPENIIKSAEALSPIYTISRYPDVEEKIGLEDAKNMKRNCWAVMEWVKKEIMKK